MDTKTTQLDFKILVDQTLNCLEKFDAVSRCDALHYLLRNLKYKYPEACEQVIPNIFPATFADNKKHLQLLLSTKKEECIKSEDENASTDLNQNFEKILCKEEFMCLDEDDNAYADDVDNENSSSLSKRVRYAASNAARGAIRTAAGRTSRVQQTLGDPLDLIPSSVIHARRLGRIATADADADESNSLDALGPENSLKRSRRRAFGFNAAAGRSSFGKLNPQTSRLLLVGEKLQRISRLGEGYVFHPDTEFTVRFHYSSQELSIRVFKEQFRLHLKSALKRHDKEFLKEFQREFVFNGRLLGTTPPKHVLEKLRAERLEEWQQQKLRKQQQLQQQQQQQLQLQQQQQQHHQMMLMQQRRRMLAGSLHNTMSASAGNAYDSEMEFELETESQLSSASQEIMKFEEVIDEGVGPGRLIDGLVMEPEMDDVIGGGSGASVSGGSSNSSGGNGLDSLPNDLANNDSVSTFVGNSASGTTAGGATFKNHLAQQQQQHGPNNTLMMNGITTSIANNVIANNINEQQQQNANPQKQQQQQLQATAQGNSLSNMASKEQQLHPQHQLQYHPQIISNQQLQQPHNHKLAMLNDKQQPHHVNNLMNNMGGQPPTQQPHFQHQAQQQQQRFMMQQQQQQNHYNSHMQQQNHPLAMIGGMMETANQQHQQQIQVQRMQLNASNNMINSIDNILGGPTPNKPTPPPPHGGNAENLQYMHPQQQLPPHMQNLPPQQQQHMLMQQQQQNLLGAGANLTPSTTPTSSIGLMPNSSTTPTGNSSANASFEHDDEGLSHDEDDEDHENDTNDGMEPKQQLIDGGSSSSTSLQAPSGAGNTSTPGTKKEKPSYNCLLCPKSYRKRKSLLDHYKIHPGYCHDCGKPNGTSLEEIIHHNRTVHAKEFPFVCETCGESYSRRQQFHAHVESHNKKEFKNIVSVSLAYSCIECGQKFPHKKLHQQHLDDTGHKADGAICEVCGDEFPSKNALYQHIIRVHKKDNFFECHICQNRFTLKANLERHVQLHTEIKRTYVCDLCGSSYFTYPALKDHYSNAHTDASECKCTLCGKRFGSVKSLQRHLPSHSEERPHCCCYCDQTFKWKTHLVRHKQTVHGNQPSPKKVKRFSKEGDELVPLADEPGPPPAKVAKKSNASKPKQQTNPTPPIQQQQQQKMGAIATPPPLSTTPGTSSSSQQDPFNAAIISNNSSQSSTASTSQHSLQSSESQPNSMYSQNFSAEKLLGQHTQQQQQQQQQQPQQQQILTAHNAQPQSHPLPQQQQQQQRPTPPPHPHPHPQQQPPPQQQQQQPPLPPQQQQQQPPPPQHHRHTPNSHTPDNNLPRINSFGGGGPSQPETQFHFEQSAAGGQTSNITTNPGAYPQHQIINQYQQQHHQQQLQQQAAQQQHMRSHTPQSPHHHVQHQQHFPSPHQQHMQSAAQHQQQLQHHHQQMMHQQQLQQQQHQQQQQQQQPHQRQHNQQRSPHPHQTPTQQLQQQHQHQHQQPMHSPQHVRLQSPAPQANTPQPHTPQPQQQQQPPTAPQQQQPQQQQQQQPASVAANHQQQYTTDAWGNINFVGHPSNASNHQQQQQQQQQQNNTTNLPGDKDNPNKFYIVDSSEFLGLPMNVAGGNTPGVAETNNQLTNAQQQQQQQTPMVANKPPQQQQQQQEPNIGSDLMSFQNMWPQANQPSNQMAYSANGAQQQQQQQQPPQTQQQQGASQQPTAAVASVAATDPHNYNNIGSILTNLIDNNPNPMEYNFELMQQQQQQQQQQGSGGSGTATPVGAQQTQQQQSQQTPLGVQHHQQQQHQPSASAAAAAAYGLQPTPGASGLIRHGGVYGAPSSLYDPHHHPAHHPSSLAEMNEQQKNSFQPYHPHAGLQPHAHALGGHPLAPTAHHPLAAASHLLPPPPPHAGHHVYDRGGYPVLGGGVDEAKAVLPPISDYMHHMQQQHVQQPDLLYYPVKND